MRAENNVQNVQRDNGRLRTESDLTCVDEVLSVKSQNACTQLASSRLTNNVSHVRCWFHGCLSGERPTPPGNRDVSAPLCISMQTDRSVGTRVSAQKYGSRYNGCACAWAWASATCTWSAGVNSLSSPHVEDVAERGRACMPSERSSLRLVVTSACKQHLVSCRRTHPRASRAAIRSAATI